MKTNKFLPFEEARKFAQSLKLEKVSDWKLFCESGNRPKNIPSCPNIVYGNYGWISWNNWIGNKKNNDLKKRGGYIRGNKKIFIPYSEAKKLIRPLCLMDKKDWENLVKSGKKPDNIPSCPYDYYRLQWGSWEDFLGQTASYRQARRYIRKFNLKDKNAFNRFIKRRNKREDIPTNPEIYYSKNNTWVSWKDFLRYYDRADSNKKTHPMPFKILKELVINAGIKSGKEYSDFRKLYNKSL